MQKTEKLDFRLAPELKESLRLEAEAMGRSLGEICSEALEQWLEKRKKARRTVRKGKALSKVVRGLGKGTQVAPHACEEYQKG
jgi:predicted transcriptional regulator